MRDARANHGALAGANANISTAQEFTTMQVPRTKFFFNLLCKIIPLIGDMAVRPTY